MHVVAVLLAFLTAQVHADDGVLIFGTTGRTGSEIARALVARGERVTGHAANVQRRIHF